MIKQATHMLSSLYTRKDSFVHQYIFTLRHINWIMGMSQAVLLLGSIFTINLFKLGITLGDTLLNQGRKTHSHGLELKTEKKRKKGSRNLRTSFCFSLFPGCRSNEQLLHAFVPQFRATHTPLLPSMTQFSVFR